ncbi:chromatin assembly factor subunit [Theileria orientalis]|uniref:Chromatin assembly factor subunit n=1 Tax=Theileria orientalis TaxID=68886 RepID=A0A976M9Y7_THEOR|nr:chromatin assembly factor subunit [Theileria orientalis]
MESVILSGPGQVKIRRKYPLPSGFTDPYDSNFDPLYNNDPFAPQEEPEEEAEPYFVWRRNAPFLYDSVSVYNLEWPSLTVDFMDDSKNFRVKNGSLTQRLLLGTHTSGTETEFAMVAELRTGVYSLRENMTTCENYNGFVSARKNKENNPAQPSYPSLDIKAKIVHPGEINRISHVPGTHFSFITQSNNGTLYQFDYSKHPFNPRDVKTSLPQLVLGGGHSSEGYGITWNSSKKLVSCASDGSLCLWDMNARSATQTKSHSGVADGVPVLTPISTYSNTGTTFTTSGTHKSVNTSVNTSSNNTGTNGNTNNNTNTDSVEEKNALNDVEFLYNDDNVVITASDDGNVYLVDLRSASTGKRNNDLSRFNTDLSHNSHVSNSVELAMTSVASVDSGVNCLSVNTFNNNYFVCGCENGNIYLYDLRMPSKSVLLLDHHKESVSQIEFNRACCGLFASSSNDATVCIFDIGCRGQELRFVHQGHKAQVNDISWAKLNPYQAGHVGFTLASVSQDNLLQCFTPNYSSL